MVDPVMADLVGDRLAKCALFGRRRLVEVQCVERSLGGDVFGGTQLGQRLQFQVEWIEIRSDRKIFAVEIGKCAEGDQQFADPREMAHFLNGHADQRHV